MPTIACPDSEILQNLLLGKLAAPEREELSEHLQTCEACVALADTLSPNDSLTAALRKRRVFPAPDEKLAEAIEKAKQIQPPQETVPEGQCFGEDTSIPQSSADCTVKVPDTAFLHPAEQPDEMGRLGGYRVLDVLGAGGMGIVFLAEDAHLKRLVALKAMMPSIAQDDAAKNRFLREAQATAAIEHDHIVSIYQVGEDQGVPFIAMRHLRGESLKTRLEREGQLDQRDVLRIGREIASGLAVAHAHGLIHRDIKPDNIWLEGEQGRVKILDFGLVRAVTSDVELTQSGVVMGTPKYMAPEQAEGQTVDSRSDLFSLGSVLYHLAAGRPPFEAPNLTATLMAVTHHTPVSIESVRPELSPELARLIMELLAKNREARPQSAEEVVDRIRLIEGRLDQEATLPFALPTQPANRFPGGRKKSMILAALAGCVILFGVILIIRDRDGKVKQQYELKPGDTLEIADRPAKTETPSPAPAKEPVIPKPSGVAVPQIPAIETTDPVRSYALVTRPAKLDQSGVTSWTLETIQHRSPVSRMMFQPKGRLLAFVTPDGVLRLLDGETGRTEKVWVQPFSGLHSLAWSPEGDQLAVISWDNELAFWSPDEGRMLSSHRIRNLANLSWSPDGKRLALSTGRLEFWDVEAGQLIPSPKPSPRCQRLTWCPDAKTIAIGDNTQGIFLVDAQSRQVVRKVFEKEDYHNGDFAWSPDGRYLANIVQGRDHAKVWDKVEDRIRRVEYPEKPQNVTPFGRVLTWSPVGKLTLNFGRSDSALFAAEWDLETGKPGPWMFAHAQAGMACLEWSSDGQILAMGTHNGRLLAYRAENPEKPLWDKGRPTVGPNQGTWSADGENLAFLHKTINSDWGHEELCVWNAPSNRLAIGPPFSSLNLAFSSDGTQLLVPHLGNATLFDARSLDRINDLQPKNAYAGAISKDGKKCAIAVQDGVALRDVLDDTLIQRLPAPGLTKGCTVAWSNDGRYLAAGHESGPTPVFYLWNAQTREPKELGQEISRQGWPDSFSPEGLLLVRRVDGFHVLDPAQGKVVWSVAVSECQAVAWTENHQCVRTIDRNGIIKRWDLNQPIAVEEVRLPMTLSCRAQFLPGAATVMMKPAGMNDRGTFWFWNTATGQPLGTLVILTGGKHLFISPEGHYSGSAGIEKELVYVAQTAEGQEMLSPAEFSKRFGWKNNPALATPLLAARTSESGGTP
jgi:serine/threonine protein kinase/WD40 repeat protein